MHDKGFNLNEYNSGKPLLSVISTYVKGDFAITVVTVIFIVVALLLYIVTLLASDESNVVTRDG